MMTQISQGICEVWSVFVVYRKCPKISNTKLTKWHMQTVQTQIRLLLKEQSDQGLHCLPIHYVF